MEQAFLLSTFHSFSCEWLLCFSKINMYFVTNFDTDDILLKINNLMNVRITKFG